MSPSKGTPRQAFRMPPALKADVASKAAADGSDMTKVTIWLWEFYRDLPPKVQAGLKAKAARDGTTLTAVIVAALERYVAEEDGVSH